MNLDQEDRMSPPSEAQSNAHQVNGHRHPAEDGLVNHLVSAAPLRTKKASADLAATLEDLGADPFVVEAAKGE